MRHVLYPDMHLTNMSSQHLFFLACLFSSFLHILRNEMYSRSQFKEPNKKKSTHIHPILVAVLNYIFFLLPINLRLCANHGF